MSNKGRLYLIPNVIADSPPDMVIPPVLREVLKNIRHFLAEDIRTARRYLSSLGVYENISQLEFSVLNKDTDHSLLPGLMAPALAGFNIGVISEAGCPGIADPGAAAVMFAHLNDIEIVPLVGPSSIFLALMASGLNGQQFAFHGYLPIQSKEAGKVLKDLEKESRAKKQTQIFIETPYRNNVMFSNLIKNLNPDTHLCIALEVTGRNESIKTQTVRSWSGRTVHLPKSPAVFLFLA